MGVAVRRAGEGDRKAVTRLLDDAFQNDPVSRWVFPDAEDRRRTHPLLMRVLLGIVLEEGYVDVTEDGSACALWLPVPAEAQEEGEDEGGAGAAKVREAVDPDNERIEQIGQLTAQVHPAGTAHEYLWMIGVAPERQNEGVGTALIRHVLDRCDRENLGAYLEASSARSRALYERLGFTFTGRTVELPDGPPLWPMWRDPAPGS